MDKVETISKEVIGITEPKDLGVKIGTKEEAAWKIIKESQEQNIRTGKINVEVAEAVLRLAEIRIIEEQENFKK